MTAREKFPDLWRQYEALLARKAELEAPVAELRAKRDAVVARMQPLEDEARELAAAVKPHLPALAEVDRQVAALARAMGGRSTADNPE
jgi:cell division protein FtsB